MMNFTALAHGQKNEVLVKRKTAETIAAEAPELHLPHRGGRPEEYAEAH